MRIEIWHVIRDDGAYYTLERNGHQRDFLKLDVVQKLIPGQYVEVCRDNSFRTIM